MTTETLWRWRCLMVAITAFIFGYNLADCHAKYDSTPLAAVATALVGQPTPVHCQHLRDGEMGHTVSVSTSDGLHYFEPDIWLDYSTCRQVQHLLAGRPIPDTLQAYTAYGNSLLTLEHESMHIRLDSDDEAHVECVATRHVWQDLIKHLDYPPATLRKLKHGEWWAHMTLSADIYITEC